MAPAGAGHVLPPAVVVGLPYGFGRWHEHDRGRLQLGRICIGVEGRISEALSQGSVAGGLHKLQELGIGDRGPIDPEPRQLYPVGRGLFWVVVIGAHQKRAPRNPHHAGCRGPLRGHGSGSAAGSLFEFFHHPLQGEAGRLLARWELHKGFEELAHIGLGRN